MKSSHDRHDHGVDLDAFLDLVNTVELTDGLPDERLATPADAVAFFAGHGLGHEDALQEAAADVDAAAARLATVRDVRAAAREVWDAVVERRDADAAAIDRLNEALRHRPLVELTPGVGGCGVGHRHAGDPWDEALARTLEPFVAAVANDETERFRICANDGCRWVFYDASRPGRRRWCDMATCGNRAKAARHRARRRTAAADAGEATAAGSPG